MFFNESAKLARNLARLKDLIERCDDRLSNITGDAEIRPDKWAIALNDDESRVTENFDHYVAEKLLRKSEQNDCECGMACDLSDAICPDCQTSLKEAPVCQVYTFADVNRTRKGGVRKREALIG